MLNNIAVGMLVMGALMGNAYAADTDVCPKAIDIKAAPYKSSDPQLPAPFNEGFAYTANAGGKAWTGVSMGTEDDFLDKKYDLKAKTVVEQDGKVICSYGGTKIIEQGVTLDPYLKLVAK
ncbi:hypothetical protein [Pseudomonas sp. F01002]|uniref:hypothetical protein n=1 Tax=Pseudomonas sp. F01002 TaxID=2555724 RepID=UPI00211426CE|nr:hypothetical protein [Pseudomonas sp. F01002]